MKHSEGTKEKAETGGKNLEEGGGITEKGKAILWIHGGRGGLLEPARDCPGF